MKLPFQILLSIAAVYGAAASNLWLDQVAPVITPAEKKLYLSLQPEARQTFEENFWSTKSITAGEYFTRLEHIDSTYGSKKPGSGANTDPGRVYLSLGPPSRVTRIPSSRVFVPLEIWYYDTVPGVLNTELRLILYQTSGTAFPKLYSPTVDTIRALLNPLSGNLGLFGPNDSTTETDIRQKLNVGPAEDEILSAAANVATGIKYGGNDEILGRISSPEAMLGKPVRTETTSRFIVGRPKLDTFESPSAYGGSQVDLRLEATAQSEIDLEVSNATGPVYRNQVHLKFVNPESLTYTHRLDLLPGSYRLLFSVDGTTYPYLLDVHQVKDLGSIVRAESRDTERKVTPFGFSGKELDLDADGKIAAVATTAARVTWRIRQGVAVVWKSVSESDGAIASVELPLATIAPGAYRLEAVTETDSRSIELTLKHDSAIHSPGTVISFNANLAPALRFAFVGRQYIQLGKFDEARKTLENSLALGATEPAEVDLARTEALTGNLDAARDRLRRILATHPRSFEALSVYAYVETQFQDYPVAAQLYRRALAVQDSAALRSALSNLPGQQQ